MRIVAIVVVSLLVVYPVAVNSLLALGGVQKMFEGTDQVKLDFHRAWSLWPGHVHVEQVRLTMQDRNVEFSLELAHADVEITLRELFHRTLHATKVRGDGVVFRFRNRVDPESADSASVRALPPIPEFEDPPLRYADAPTPPLDEAHYNLWTVHMEDVDVGVREIWAQMFRFEGEARARGAFRLRPAKRVWVMPGELTLTNGSVSTGPDDVMRSVEGVVVVGVEDFDTYPVHGMEPFHFISARLSLRAQVVDLDAVNFLGEPSADFRVQDGSGSVVVDAAVDHGIFTSESRLTYRTDHIAVTASSPRLGGPPPKTIHVDGELVFSATGLTGQPRGQLALDLARGALHLEDRAQRSLELNGVHAAVESTNIDVTRAWAPAGGHARIEEAALADLRWLNDLPLGHKRWTVSGGRGHARGTVTVSPANDVQGSVDAAVEDASGSVGQLRWRGSADATAIGRSIALQEGSVTGRIGLGLFKISNGDLGSSETTGAEINGEVTFKEETGGVHGHLTARTRHFQGDLADKRLVVSSSMGTVQFTGQNARGNVQLHDVQATSNGMTSSTPLANVDGTFLFRSKRESAGELRGTAEQWTADFGNSRLEGSSVAAHLLFAPERIVGNLQGENIKASSLGTCPFAEMKFASLAGHLQTPAHAPLTGQLRGSLDGLSLRWGEFTAAANRLAFSGAWDGTTAAARVDSSLVRLKNGVGAPKSWQADATATTVKTSLTVAGGEVRGPLRVDVQQIVGQVGSTRIGGDVVADLELISKDESHRTADVSGVVQARKVGLSSKQYRTDNWWADFKIDSAHIDARQNLDMAGKVRARLRDGLPALNVLASQEEIPKWIPSVLPLKDITLDLNVERFCGWSDVQVLGASGGPLLAKGRLQSEPGETRGAITLRLASLGFVSVGLDFVEDYSNMSLLAGDTWLEKHLAPMTRAATDRHDAVCRREPPTCK